MPCPVPKVDVRIAVELSPDMVKEILSEYVERNYPQYKTRFVDLRVRSYTDSDGYPVNDFSMGVVNMVPVDDK